MNIANCIDEFLLSLEARNRAQRTIAVYEQRLSVLRDLGDIKTIAPNQLDTLIVMIRKRDLSLATIAGYVQAWRTFCNWCVKRKYLSESPAGGLERPDLRHQTRYKAMCQEDLERMIQAAIDRGLALELALLLMFADTGCRAGEIRAINLADVDLARCEAHTHGKTGEADLDFTEQTADALRAWLLVRPATDDDALFTTSRGRISYGRIYDCIEALAHDLGITRHNPHAIRHRVGQGWMDAGANLELIRLKLRHKDISTTAMIYGNQDRSRLKQASRRYSLIKPK